MSKISVRVSPISGTTTQERGVIWEAVAHADNWRYTVQDRGNPVRTLCRELVHLGIPDAEMTVYDQHGRLALTFKSFHRAAKRTLKESVKHPIKLAKFEEFPVEAHAKKLAAE
jgi:hypothetical protein